MSSVRAVVPVEEFLPSFPFYEDGANTAVCGFDAVCLSHRHRALLSIAYPAPWTVSRCCDPSRYGYADCEEYLTDAYGAYLTGEEIEAAAESLLSSCGRRR